MPSIFEEVTRAVVQELDAGGDMIAVRSIIEADRLHCFYLVRQKRNFLGRRYYSTNLTLEDILEREESEGQSDKLDSGFQGQKAEVQVVDMVDPKGMLTVKLPTEITIGGVFHESQEQAIKILQAWIPQHYLNSLENRKLKKNLPASWTMREDLYLVTETVEIAETATLKSERKYAFLSQLDLCGLNYERKHQRAVTIPPKKVLGYRIKQLVCPNMERINICFFGKAKSFPEETDGDSSHLGKSWSLEDFRNLKEKVQDVVSGLEDLTEKERKDMLSCLTECLTKDQELQDLEQRVSELQMEGPAGPLLCGLFNAVGILVEARREAILDLLDALMELSEEKQLVAEALEKGTLPLLKEQVESLLEQNWDEHLHDVAYDPEAQIICALYVSASILLQLSEKPASVSS